MLFVNLGGFAMSKCPDKKAELVKQKHVQLELSQVDFVSSDGQLAHGCQEK